MIIDVEGKPLIVTSNRAVLAAVSIVITADPLPPVSVGCTATGATSLDVNSDAVNTRIVWALADRIITDATATVVIAIIRTVKMVLFILF
jgi:hypothetical protein